MGVLEDRFLGEVKTWPFPEHAERIRAAQGYNRLLEGELNTLRYWVKKARGKNYPISEFIPYPAPEIAARTLATFLFGEDAEFTSKSQPDSLKELLEKTHLHALNQEMSITAAAEGEIFVKIDWDEEVSNRALITPMSTCSAYPVYRFRNLVECAFVEEFKEKDGKSQKVWRHVEIREKRRIVHFLFEGTSRALGASRDLDSRPETEELEDEVDTGIDDLLVRHIPFWRTARSPEGISIFRAKEGLISGIHALYSQDQHDAEMAKRRVAMSEAFLKRDGQGNIEFDRELDIFALDDAAAGALGAEGKPIHAIEFSDNTIMGQRIAQRINEFLLACGIAPQSAGRDVSGGAESGTARKLAQALTLQTTASAGRYFVAVEPELVNLCSQVTRKHLDKGFPEWSDTLMSLSDGFVDDPVEQADRIQTLRGAKAISANQAVQEQHPDWTDEQVDEEVNLILEEEGMTVPKEFVADPQFENEPAVTA